MPSCQAVAVTATTRGIVSAKLVEERIGRDQEMKVGSTSSAKASLTLPSAFEIASAPSTNRMLQSAGSVCSWV